MSVLNWLSGFEFFPSQLSKWSVLPTVVSIHWLKHIQCSLHTNFFIRPLRRDFKMERTSYQVNVKNWIWCLDVLLYFDPKHLFINISIIQIMSVCYLHYWDIQWQHQNYSFALVLMKNSWSVRFNGSHKNVSPNSLAFGTGALLLFTSVVCSIQESYYSLQGSISHSI